ncbi:hypothetical protein QR680_003583 [Steinernema hermaphroditum]|uniref:BTB domain-containing protein n=1 Tax=Steinernema hermaphroditum TaxID=289476 RepID=A0AA39HM87_9BILA|nr:hypothetical protein QR680_003583 [Steinernema hermaphroditum]
MEPEEQSTSSPYEWIRRKRVSQDFFYPTELTDCILVVEGMQLFVNMAFLGQHSSYFEELFDNSAEENKFVLEGVRIREFHDFLVALHPNRGPIEGRKVEHLLRLAHRFETIDIINDVSLFLIGSAAISDAHLIDVVRVADRHSLKDVVESIINTVKNPRILMILRKINDFSSSTKADIYHRLRALDAMGQSGDRKASKSKKKKLK